MDLRVMTCYSVNNKHFCSPAVDWGEIIWIETNDVFCNLEQSMRATILERDKRLLIRMWCTNNILTEVLGSHLQRLLNWRLFIGRGLRRCSVSTWPFVILLKAHWQERGCYIVTGLRREWWLVGGKEYCTSKPQNNYIRFVKPIEHPFQYACRCFCFFVSLSRN